eukprot:g19537.t1
MTNQTESIQMIVAQTTIQQKLEQQVVWKTVTKTDCNQFSKLSYMPDAIARHWFRVVLYYWSDAVASSCFSNYHLIALKLSDCCLCSVERLLDPGWSLQALFTVA